MRGRACPAIISIMTDRTLFILIIASVAPILAIAFRAVNSAGD